MRSRKAIRTKRLAKVQTKAVPESEKGSMASMVEDCTNLPRYHLVHDEQRRRWLEQLGPREERCACPYGRESCRPPSLVARAPCQSPHRGCFLDVTPVSCRYNSRCHEHRRLWRRWKPRLVASYREARTGSIAQTASQQSILNPSHELAIAQAQDERIALSHSCRCRTEVADSSLTHGDFLLLLVCIYL